MPRITRLSESNVETADQILQFQEQLFKSVQDRDPFLERNATKSTMVLPAQYTSQVAPYICDIKSLRQLEVARVINWCMNIRCLTPMPVLNDGNSLAHAVSVYIFGVQDKKFYFRKLIYTMLFRSQPPVNQPGELHERWMSDQTGILRSIVSSIPAYYEKEKEKTWDYHLGLCSNYKDNKGNFSELEAIHIFALANIIARSIFVYTARGPTNEETIQAIRLEGIYLPLLRNDYFEKSPVLLGYVNGKFIPLFSAEGLDLQLWGIQPSPAALHCAPIVRSDLSPLPVRFLMDKEKKSTAALLEKYLDLVPVPNQSGQVDAVMMKFRPPPAQSIELLWSMLAIVKGYVEEDNKVKYPAQHVVLDHHGVKPCARRQIGICKSNGYANPEKEGLCNECYNEFLVAKGSTKRRDVNRVPIPKQSAPIPRPRQKLSSLDAQNKENCIVCHASDVILNNMCQPCYDESVIQKYKERDYITMKAPNQVKPRQQAYVAQQQKSNCGRCGVSYEGSNQFALCPECYHMVLVKQKEEEQNRNVVAPASGGAMGGGDAFAFDRKKVFCKNAGCENKICQYSDDLCQKHLDLIQKDKPKVQCTLCNKNQADDNRFGLCLTCLNEQQDVLAEISIKKKQEKNVNIGRGVVNEEPLEMGDEFLASLPMIPVPNQNKNIHYAIPRQQGAPTHYGAPEHQHFKPPTLYEGFSSAEHNFGNQQGAMNWQRDKINQQQVCSHCTQPAKPGNAGMCDNCRRAKEEDLQQKQYGQKGVKCGNPDRPSCKNYVYDAGEFMCDDCIREQREGMQNVAGQQQQQPNLFQQERQQEQWLPPQQPNMQNMFQEHEYNRNNFDQQFLPMQQGQMQQGQMPQGQMPPGQMPPGQMLPGQMSPVQMPQGQMSPVQMRDPCKAFDCDFYGNPEFGGYCSNCFFEVTKHDANKQGGRPREPMEVNELAPGGIGYSPFNRPASGGGMYPQIPTTPPAAHVFTYPQMQTPPPLPPARSFGSDVGYDVNRIQEQMECKHPDCDMFGRWEWDGYCSQCFKMYRVERD